MLSLTKDKQSDLPEVDTIVMGRHNSTVDSMSTGKVTLTGFSTTHSNSPGATRNLVSPVWYWVQGYEGGE